MQASLRKVLIDSHVAIIAIAVLIFFSAQSVTKAFFALKDPAFQLVFFVIKAVAIRDIYFISRTHDPLIFLRFLSSLSFLLSAIIDLAAAWLISSWVYGTGPMRALGNYRGVLLRKTHA